MTIRRKVILIISLAIVVIVSITYLLARFTLLDSLKEIERSSVERKVAQASSTMHYFLADIERANADWSSWDDTYEFVAGNNVAAYTESNLLDEAFVTLDINMMAYIDESGSIFYSKAVDLTTQEETAISADLHSFIKNRGLELRENGYAEPDFGIIPLEEGPMMITSQPILHSDDSGPSRGILIFGRYLDSGLISRMEQLTGHTVSIYPIARANDSDDLQRALSSLADGAPIFTYAASREFVNGYTLLDDVYGNHTFIMQIEVYRDIFQTGQKTIFILVLYALGSTLLVGLACIYFIQQNVLSRLSGIVDNINRIRQTGDSTISVAEGQADELAMVADTMNELLVSLRQSYEGLRESEENYRLLADNSTDVILTTDMQLKPNYFSPSIERLTGYRAHELAEDFLKKILTPESQQAVWQTLQEEVRNEPDRQTDPNIPRRLEIQILRRDGSTVWAEASTIFLRDTDGKANGVLATIRDISERREAQAQLEALYNDETEIRQRLEDELERRIQFTRALVHELKTPITPVLVSSDLLLEEIQEGPLRRIARNISEGAARLSQRIDELVDLAKMEIGTVELNKEYFEPALLMEDIQATMKPMAERGGQQLDTDVAAGIGTAYADTERLRQVLLNLLTNSFKFTPPGGRIVLRARREGDNLLIEVEDNGRGMSLEEQETLFNPYYKTEDDRARLSGLGLGLYLSKSFVELHGGRIWVESKRGKGSKFSFTIPLGNAAADDNTATEK